MQLLSNDADSRQAAVLSFAVSNLACYRRMKTSRRNQVEC